MSPLALLVCIVFYKVFCTFRVAPIDGDASWVYKNCYFVEAKRAFRVKPIDGDASWVYKNCYFVEAKRAFSNTVC